MDAPTGGGALSPSAAGTFGVSAGGGEADGEASLVVRPFGYAALQALGDAELAAVDNFEVEVAGVGRLRWPGKTDVRAELPRLSEVVKLSPHQVLVYDNVPGLPKPPPGEGLNKLCEYTMCGVWAKDRQTGEYLSDAKSLSTFRSQLLRKADRMQARMVSYDATAGEWVIEVPHF